MNIGIIGAGNVGGTLGRRWARNGHRVCFGSREPDSEKMRALLAEAGENATAASNAETASASEVLLVATPWDAAEKTLRASGNLAGKILIDATNPLLPGLDGLAVGGTQSAAELIAKSFPGAKVVKAFNTVGYNIMADPAFDHGRVAMFYCGDDSDAKKKVGGLIGELGFEALDAGPLRQARVLEPFALLWVSLALKYGYTREIGFQLLRRAQR
ncbi:MAG TPA: NADPH-dependent F420 reductase [Bryobacteraceae bacterium]|nr:NADPH-dependent F420 reductase [Bryobacteraceae bacterium]